MGIVSGLKARVRSALLSRATAGGGLDLSKIDRIPESLSWPLQRNGFDPVPRLGDVRDADPVHKLTSYFGITVWLVTGDAEAREVLSTTAATATTSVRSSDRSRVRPRMATSGASGSPTRRSTPGCGSC